MLKNTDKEIVKKLLVNDRATINEFFFVHCRELLTYIGHYFCRDRQCPEELIGEFYEFLSADNWRKLRIFKYSCSLNSYVTIIASRYFQHKREREMLPLDDMPNLTLDMQEELRGGSFLMEDLRNIMERMLPLDRFLLQRILIDGEKPGDILDEARALLAGDEHFQTQARDRKEFAGYIYTRYNKVRKKLQKRMQAIGYEN